MVVNFTKIVTIMWLGTCIWGAIDASTSYGSGGVLLWIVLASPAGMIFSLLD